jgi:hypothetical protein
MLELSACQRGVIRTARNVDSAQIVHQPFYLIREMQVLLAILFAFRQGRAGTQIAFADGVAGLMFYQVGRSDDARIFGRWDSVGMHSLGPAWGNSKVSAMVKLVSRGIGANHPG